MKSISAIDKTPCASLNLAQQRSEPRKTIPVRRNKMQSNALLDAQHALQALPEVDDAQIAAVRAALSRGDIPIDADALAKAMLAWHQS